MAISNAQTAQEAAQASSTATDSSTTAKVASAAHSAVDVAAKNLEKAEIALREAQEAAGHKVSETARDAKSYSEDALSSVQVLIKENPVRSIGVAFATGYLLSALLKK